MPSRNYLQHGSRHRPQGTDPIPGAGGGAWAILQGTQLHSAGSNSATLAASATGLPVWTSFIVGGDLTVFATHNGPSYPGGGDLPPVSSFHNTSGDLWIFAIQPGTLIGYLDTVWSSATSFPIQIATDVGGATYQGGLNFGPQAWESVAPATSGIHSWSFIRPIDNDPFDQPNLYFAFAPEVTNLDSVGHTLDGSFGVQLFLQWQPVSAGVLNQVY